MNETVSTAATASNEEALLLTRLIVQKVATPMVVLVGVIGNSLSIVVLTRKCMKSSTNSYLSALAMFDLMYLLFSFSLSLRHYPESVMTSPVYVYWFPFGRVLTDMSSNVSVTLTVTFTVERYIGVCHPMRGRTLCTPQRARMITLLVSIIAILCTVPEFWELEVVATTTMGSSYVTAEGKANSNVNLSNFTEYSFRYTPFAQNPAYGVGYYWFLVLAFTFLPLVLLCVFNGILILTLIRATKLRKEMAVQVACPSPQPHKAAKFPGTTAANRFILRGRMKWNGYYNYSNPTYANGNGASPCNNVPTTSAPAQPGSGCGAYSKKNRSSHAKEQQKITKLLITVVLVFIVCQLPGALLLSYQTYLSLQNVVLSRYWANVKKMAANVTNILVSINASINFILYSAISLRFRRVFYRVFCRCRMRSGGGNGVACCWAGGQSLQHSAVESKTDAIQMSSYYYYEGNRGRQQQFNRQPLVYKASRSRSPFSKESPPHWHNDKSAVTSPNHNAVGMGIHHGGSKCSQEEKSSGFQSFHKAERNPCIYS